jgi:hypothetical protein
LLICWCQTSLPTEHGSPTLPLSLTTREPLLSHQRVRTPDSPLRGGKLKPASLQGAPEALFPQAHRSQHFTLHLPSKESCLFVQELESQLFHRLSIHYPAGAGRPIPPNHSAQRPSAPHCNSRRAPVLPSKSGNSSSLTEGRKEAIGTTTRPLQGVTYLVHPSLRNIAGAPGRKRTKNHQLWGIRD